MKKKFETKIITSKQILTVCEKASQKNPSLQSKVSEASLDINSEWCIKTAKESGLINVNKRIDSSLIIDALRNFNPMVSKQIERDKIYRLWDSLSMIAGNWDYFRSKDPSLCSLDRFNKWALRKLDYQSMITSKKISRLIEYFYKRIKVGSETFDIYENPGSSDVVSLLKELQHCPTEIRFIADAKSQKVYVWGAYFAEHNAVKDNLNIGSSYYVNQTPWIFEGNGNISGGRILGNLDLATIGHLKQDMRAMLSWESSNKGYPPSIQNQDYLTKFKREKEIFNTVLTYNWSFLDRYILGINKEIELIKKEYSDFIKRTGL